MANCSITTLGAGFEPSAYVRSSGHESAGLTAAASVVKRDSSGNPDAGGLIGWINIGMSNMQDIQAVLRQVYLADLTRNPAVRHVNGGQSGMTAMDWADDEGEPWSILASKVTSQGLTAAQVQIVYVMMTQAFPGTNGAMTDTQLIAIKNNLKTKYPNVTLIYWSSIPYTGYSTGTRAPGAYVWGDHELFVDIVESDLTDEDVWSDYYPLYADGETVNDDTGVVGTEEADYGPVAWFCAEFQSDGVHLADAGLEKCTHSLLDRWRVDPISEPILFGITSFDDGVTSETSSHGTTVTSHSVSLPSSIAAGDRLLIVFHYRDSVAPTWPTGWDSRLDHGTGVADRLAIRERIADGLEGGSITVTTTNACRSAHHAYRIPANKHDAAVALAVGTPTNGTNTAPNASSLSPAGGATRYNWLTICATRGDVSFTGTPANYGNLVERLSNAASNGSRVGVVRRTLDAASDDAGAWTLSSSPSLWHAVTVAVAPFPPPTITGVVPDEVEQHAVGSLHTITGTGFHGSDSGATTVVYLSGGGVDVVDYTVISDTEIEIEITDIEPPADLGVRELLVETDAGVSAPFEIEVIAGAVTGNRRRRFLMAAG